jgi:hypothetical protein
MVVYQMVLGLARKIEIRASFLEAVTVTNFPVPAISVNFQPTLLGQETRTIR